MQLTRDLFWGHLLGSIVLSSGTLLLVLSFILFVLQRYHLISQSKELVHRTASWLTVKGGLKSVTIGKAVHASQIRNLETALPQLDKDFHFNFVSALEMG